MLLGALIDLGVGVDQLQQELSKLELAGYHIHARKAQQSQIQGVKFDVHVESEPERPEHAQLHHHAAAQSHHVAEAEHPHPSVHGGP